MSKIDTVAILEAGVTAEAGGAPVTQAAAERDALIVAFLHSRKALDNHSDKS